MKRLVFCLLFALGATAAAAQSTTLIPDSIAVTGTGRTTLTPDRYTFTVGVQTIAQTVESAVNENNARLAAIIAALKKAGAAEKEIRTSAFSIWPQQDYSQQGKLPRILGYQVSNNVTITRDKVSDAGKLLQAALNAGVNSSSGLQFEVSDPTRGRDQGLKAAFADARAKAVLLAQAAGRNLGQAIAIREGSEPINIPSPMPQARGMIAQAEAMGQVPIESGTQEVIYAVSVVFALN